MMMAIGAFLPFAMASPVLVGWAWLGGNRMPARSWRAWFALCAQAGLSSTGYAVLLIAGTGCTSGSDASAIAGALPAVAAFFRWWCCANVSACAPCYRFCWPRSVYGWWCAATRPLAVASNRLLASWSVQRRRSRRRLSRLRLRGRRVVDINGSRVRNGLRHDKARRRV